MKCSILSHDTFYAMDMDMVLPSPQLPQCLFNDPCIWYMVISLGSL